MDTISRRKILRSLAAIGAVALPLPADEPPALIKDGIVSPAPITKEDLKWARGEISKLRHVPSDKSWDDLRAFAELPDVRAYIEARKAAVMESFEVRMRLAALEDCRCLALDGRHGPHSNTLRSDAVFLRSVLEDALVYDTVAIRAHPKENGFDWTLLDPTIIVCYTEQNGLKVGEILPDRGVKVRIPKPPNPAYCMTISGDGIRTVDAPYNFTSDELVYVHRNRSDLLYGESYVHHWTENGRYGFDLVAKSDIEGDANFLCSLIGQLAIKSFGPQKALEYGLVYCTVLSSLQEVM